MLKYGTLTFLGLCCLALSAIANGTIVADQNAFTRAAREPLTGIVTPVSNSHTIPCNGVVDCRKKGGDLSTVWQMDHTTDYSAKDYPARCYVSGNKGKYLYSAAMC